MLIDPTKLCAVVCSLIHIEIRFSVYYQIFRVLIIKQGYGIKYS